ncbi:MAG: hypothetical protein RQ729_13000 [Wenzhouxiangellaceae bacterium]|nr:hypothetical protein [Wenzhouxiangellaceae bacterium]
MNVQITVRNVPVEVRDELAARAACKGQSMQEYLRQQLEVMAARPSVEEILDRIRKRKAGSGCELKLDDILAARNADRR